MMLQKLNSDGIVNAVPAEMISKIDQEGVIRYAKKIPVALAGGSPIFSSKNGKQELIGFNNYRSDGVWVWDDEWVYRFEHGEIGIDPAFVDHIVKWKTAPLTEVPSSVTERVVRLLGLVRADGPS